MSPSSPKIYFCAGDYCPGLRWPPSNVAHPSSCALRELNSNTALREAAASRRKHGRTVKGETEPSPTQREDGPQLSDNVQIEFEPRDLDTVVAALFYWQSSVLDSGKDPRNVSHVFDGHNRDPLDSDEVTAMIKEIRRE